MEKVILKRGKRINDRKKGSQSKEREEKQARRGGCPFGQLTVPSVGAGNACMPGVPSPPALDWNNAQHLVNACISYGVLGADAHHLTGELQIFHRK